MAIPRLNNRHVQQRLAAMLDVLRCSHAGGRGLSAATQGREREQFVSLFLAQCLPPPYRLASGDVTDRYGHKTGQLDVVIESPFAPSLPLLGAAQERLYFAESVSAVFEVKSNLQQKWDEVAQKAADVGLLRSEPLGGGGGGSRLGWGKIAFFAVGYEGWKSLESLERARAASKVDAALIIDPPLFASSLGTDEGAAALGAMLIVLTEHVSSRSWMAMDLLPYLAPDPVPAPRGRKRKAQG